MLGMSVLLSDIFRWVMALLNNSRETGLVAECLPEDGLNPRDKTSRSVDAASESNDGIPIL
jgi:aspartate oxidase